MLTVCGRSDYRWYPLSPSAAKNHSLARRVLLVSVQDAGSGVGWMGATPDMAGFRLGQASATVSCFPLAGSSGPLRPHADRACARFVTTRYYPLGVQNSGNGDRQVAAVAAPAIGKTGPVPDITFLLARLLGVL